MEEEQNKFREAFFDLVDEIFKSLKGYIVLEWLLDKIDKFKKHP